jgi:hypothetical protein
MPFITSIIVNLLFALASAARKPQRLLRDDAANDLARAGVDRSRGGLAIRELGLAVGRGAGLSRAQHRIGRHQIEQVRRIGGEVLGREQLPESRVEAERLGRAHAFGARLRREEIGEGLAQELLFVALAQLHRGAASGVRWCVRAELRLWVAAASSACCWWAARGRIGPIIPPLEPRGGFAPIYRPGDALQEPNRCTSTI